MLDLALENQGVVVVEEMVAAFSRDGRFAVALFGVLHLTFVSMEFSSGVGDERSTYLPPDQLGDDSVEVFDALQRYPSVTL